MPTYIDGIGASEHIDSSGERIIIAGMDISSLAIDGIFNWEHEQGKDKDGNQITIKLPQQIVGKVLKAKKIFSEQDCEDDRELYFWHKCLGPYVYVMGELFDDYKESAKEVAGMFRYDSDRKNQNERNVMNFSIEGGKLDKQGIDVVKSLARKVTITVLACNKVSIAEMVPNETKKKDDLDGLFKTETNVEIELFKTEDIGNYMDSLKKSSPKLSLAPSQPQASAQPDHGKHIGKTKSGKDVFSHRKIMHYGDFSSQDHRDASNHHYNAIGSGDIASNRHHMGKMKLHMQAATATERREQVKTHVRQQYLDSMKKAMGAGSGNAAPGQLTGGAALAKGNPVTESAKDHKMWPQGNSNGSGGKQKGVHSEYDARGQSMAGLVHSDPKHRHEAKAIHTQKLGELKAMPKPNLTKSDILANPVAPNRMKRAADYKSRGDTVGNKIAIDGAKESHKEKLQAIKAQPKPNLTKSEDFWLNRAQEEYNNWDKKDKFVNFMAERMPQLTKTEIDLLGATLALKKNLQNEQALEQMSKALKFDFKPSGGEKVDMKSKVPEHHKGKGAELKGKVNSEVEHVETHYSGSHDTVYLKSGHQSHGQKVGKYKAGDKVTMKPHIQGTHILHHGHD